MMPSTIIKWSKTYHEDLGTMGQDGFYDYAYCYFLYSFYLPEKYSVVIRNYIDTSLDGSLFLYRGNKPVGEREIYAMYIPAILSFMHKKQGIIHFNLFDGGYKPIDLAELKDTSENLSFLEIAAA